MKGSFLSNTREVEEAFRAYDKAIKIDSKNINAIANKAYFLEKLEKNEDALKNYDKAIEISDNSNNLSVTIGIKNLKETK